MVSRLESLSASAMGQKFFALGTFDVSHPDVRDFIREQATTDSRIRLVERLHRRHAVGGLRLAGPDNYDKWVKHEIPFNDPTVVDALDNALAVDLHLLVGGVAESNVVDGAVLCEVDLLTGEHVIAELLETSLLGKLDEELHRLLGDEVLREVEEDLGTLGIVLEDVAELLEALQGG